MYFVINMLRGDIKRKRNISTIRVERKKKIERGGLLSVSIKINKQSRELKRKM